MELSEAATVSAVSTAVGLVAIVVLVLANGFFVATEFAIVAVRRSRLEQLAAAGHGRARAAQQVVGRLDTYIAACQLGITMASLALGWVGEPALAHLVEPPLEGLVGRFAPAAAHGVAIGASFAVITALHIVVGELAPKGLALQRPEGTTLWVARPMQIFELVFRWPIALLNGVGNGLLRLAGLHPARGHELVHSVEELRLLVTGSQQAGVVEASEARIASRAFTFADLTAGALMTPRTEVDAIPLDIGLEELRARVAGSRHGRLPVYQDSLDHVVGVVYVVDFYRALNPAPPEHQTSGQPSQSEGDEPRGAGHGAVDEARDAPLLERWSLLRPVVAVPASKPADDLLDEMRATGRYFAVVVDEYGGTAGIVTLDDLIEALVGPMRVEQDADGRGAAEEPPAFELAADGSWLLDGLMRLEEWEEVTGLRLAPSDHEAVETVGGLVMASLGRIPAVGDRVSIAGCMVQVEEMDGKRVARVRLLTPPKRTEAADSPGLRQDAQEAG
jgi:putative hemolysin